ncbi:sensor histidine kinase KdpD [Hyphomicrobium sp. 99]|uniref:sensor histidine kinase n=1 Tax=Hyphomicrobium sp. 99 TaxID=1163419 RepID=UPI00069606CC|nr:HAMP domain-containing sensor histidine kinase [Hyphomicrobium sp. 99]
MTSDQFNSAIGAAIAYVLLACIAAGTYVAYESGVVGRRALVEAERIGASIASYEKKNGWDKTRIALQSRPYQSDDVVLQVLDNKGQKIWSNDEVLSALEGSEQDRSAALSPMNHENATRFISEHPLTSGRLIVGMSAENAEVPGKLVYAVGLATIAGAFGAFIFFAFASHRSNTRIKAISSALAEFTSGDIEKRAIFDGPVDSLYELAYAVNVSLDRTETLLDNLNHLSADIAHNLKKPLRRLRNRLESAIENAEIAPQLRVQAEEAVRDLDDLVTVFEALLNISELQAGRARERFQDVDLRGVLAHIVETYEAIAEENGKCLKAVVTQGRLLPVRGEPGLITEMIVNLIENAIQHCPPGTTIGVALTQSTNAITLIVSDDGPGIPAKDIEAVFQRFYRLDTSRPGHGIGMPFVVAVAELHSAVFELSDNEPGLKVTVKFPINPRNLTSQFGLRMRSGRKLSLLANR